MHQANPRFKMGKGCSGVTHQGPIRGPPTETLLPLETCQGVRVTHEPGRPTPPDRAKAEDWLPAARAKSGSSLPCRWTGAEEALARAAYVRDHLKWLRPITHAEALSESCPAREALGVSSSCLDS
jgi:hypothetical protein